MSDPTRRMRRAVRYIKRGRKVIRFARKLPGFDVQMRQGEYEFKYVKGPGFELLFWPLTKPVELLVNRLPPFRRPKPTFKRLKGLNERRLL